MVCEDTDHGLVKDRKQKIADGLGLNDNLLNRLILTQQEEGNQWFNDDAIRRNISGIITGVIPEFVSAIIIFPNIRRASNTGKGTGLNEGPFPNNFVVEFG